MEKLPPSVRVLSSSQRKIESGLESLTAFEMLRDDGARYLVEVLARTTETDRSASVVTTLVARKFGSQHQDSPDETDVLITLTDITKGDVEGDERWDTVEHTLISKKGIERQPARRVKHSVGQTTPSMQDLLGRVAEFLKRNPPRDPSL